MSLVRLRSNAGTDEILGHVEEHGYCIVERLVPSQVIDALNREMAPHVAAASYGANEGAGTRTRRVGALLARSPASHQLIAHPTVLEAANRFLRKKATYIQLNLTMLNCIGPGATAQFLHRDELAWDGFQFPDDYQVELSTVWALDDFTEENGATRIVPGSHKSHRAPETYTQEDTVAAEMPKGSVIVYSGKTVHGGGANRSQTPRSALLVDYCVGWLRQEENQYLSIPMDVARTLPRNLQKLMGYEMGAPGLGHAFTFEHPLVALYPDMSPLPCTDEPPEQPSSDRSRH